MDQVCDPEMMAVLKEADRELSNKCLHLSELEEDGRFKYCECVVV